MSNNDHQPDVFIQSDLQSFQGKLLQNQTSMNLSVSIYIYLKREKRSRNWSHVYLFTSKRLMRLDTRPFPPTASTPPPSMLGMMSNVPAARGKETSVTGLWRCAGLGGTAEKSQRGQIIFTC